MKNIFLIIMIMLSTISLSQEYPIISVDDEGNSLVVFTIDQAREIDNKLEILKLIVESEKLSGDFRDISVQVIDEKKRIILKQDIKIMSLNQLISNKDKQIENLNNQIMLFENSESLLLQKVENKDKEIKLHLDRIDTLEKRTFWGTIGSSAIILTLLTLLVTK